MPSEWPRCRLETLAASQQGSIAIGPFGSRLKTDVYKKHGVALIRGTNLAGSKFFAGEFVYVSEDTARGLGNANVMPWDLVFPHRGNIGAVGLVPEASQRYALSTSLMKVTLDRKQADPLFMYYFFRSPQGQAELLKNASQVGTPGIATPLTSLRACVVPVPPVEEQVAAAQVLSSLDDRIDLLRQTNATLESIAQALFKSWFIDFDPVRARAEGREPEGMDAATAALFPAEFEESALGLIPKGWRAEALSELSVLNATSWTSRRAPHEVLYIDLTGVKANVFDPPQRLRFADAPSRARRELRAGDTLVGTVRPGNRSFGFIAAGRPGLTGSTGFAVLSPLAPHVAEFVYLCATRGENIERLAALADGGAYPAVRPEVVHATTCVIPSAALLTAFHALASPLLRAIEENTLRARSLAAVRDTLLPRLISGKLRLPEATAMMECAA